MRPLWSRGGASAAEIGVISIKPIKIVLPKDIELLELWPLADFHIGDSCCDFKLIQSWLDHIATTPNAYCILNGDLMDTAIANSVGDTYGAERQPMQQLQMCVKLFGPIKDKILCVTSGNHENRIYKSDGIDITEMMAQQLGVADKYTPTTALIFLSFGWTTRHKHRIGYTIYVTHGGGGGRKEGGKVIRLADLAGIVDADVYVHSHTHLPISFKESFIRPDVQHSTLVPVTRLFVNTSAALLYGGYGDRAGFKPNSTDTPVVYLDGTRRHLYARV